MILGLGQDSQMVITNQVAIKVLRTVNEKEKIEKVRYEILYHLSFL